MIAPASKRNSRLENLSKTGSAGSSPTAASIFCATRQPAYVESCVYGLPDRVVERQRKGTRLISLLVAEAEAKAQPYRLFQSSSPQTPEPDRLEMVVLEGAAAISSQTFFVTSPFKFCPSPRDWRTSCWQRCTNRRLSGNRVSIILSWTVRSRSKRSSFSKLRGPLS